MKDFLKRKSWVLLSLFIFVLIKSPFADAAINKQIPFYGTLQDTSGTNLAGTYDMVVRFYDAPSGGTLLDTSTHTAANGNPVTVVGGEFTIMLGSGTGNALDGVDFNSSSIYVGLTVNGDTEMTPRERLGSAAYAFNTDEIDGYDSSELLRLNATNTISYSSATPLLTIQQLGAGDILNVFDGATEVLSILDGGNVGIGNINPTSKLSVTGDVWVSGAYRDTSGDAGTVGQVLLSTLTGTNWTSTSSLGITATLGNNSVTPNNILTAGQTDEYCLTYESTGTTFEWQTCGAGGSLFTDAGATTYLTAVGDNLAIGTTTSSEKFTVAGNIKLNGSTASVVFDNLHAFLVQTNLWSYAIGQEAGLNNSGYDNFFVGDQAGYNNTASEVIAVGYESGRSNSGEYTTLLGFMAGGTNSGDENNILGRAAGYANQGSYTNMLGYLVGYSNTGSDNNFFGQSVGYSNTGSDLNVMGRFAAYQNTGSDNNIFGRSAGYLNAGSLNNMFGLSAGYANRGLSNNIIGGSAGYSNWGNYNNLIGYDAGDSNKGDYNNILGYQAGSENLGDYNEFMGYRAGFNLNATATVAIGSESLRGAGSISVYNVLNNVAIGYQAGIEVQSGGDNNILIGYRAADNLTTGNNNIIIGYDIDNITATADNRLNIGNLIFGTGLDGTGTTLASGNIGIGTSSPSSKFTVAGDARITGALHDSSGDAGAVGQVLLSTLTGTNWTSTSSLGITATLGNNSVTPNNILTTGQADEYCLTYESTGTTFEWQTCGAGSSLFTDGGATTYLTSLSDNLAIGTTTSTEKLTVVGNVDIIGDAAYIAFSGTPTIFASSTIESVAFGAGTGNGLSIYSWGLTYIGHRAGENASSSTFGLVDSTFVGTYAGFGSEVNQASLIGAYAGYQASGFNNNIIGYYAGYQSVSDSNNILGYYTGYSNTGEGNNIIGYESGYNNAGFGNDIMGYRAGYNNIGDYNILLGSDAGYGNKGDNNVAVGRYAGYDNLGLENVMIGWSAGYDNTGTSSVFIGINSGFYNRGLRNAFLGYEAGMNNYGDYTVALGFFAGGGNLGDYNNFLGQDAGAFNIGDYNNFIGFQAGADENEGDFNDFIGYQAGEYLNSTSTVAIGGLALQGGTINANNVLNTVAVGYGAGSNVRSGANNNIFIGYGAADNITTGDNNIVIGYDIDHISAALNNRLNIGNLIFGTGLDGTGTTLASGNIGIGTSTPVQKLQVRGDIRVGTTGTNGCLENYGGGVIGGTCSSDESLKTDIEAFSTSSRSYLESIAQLTPVTYKWNETAESLYSKDVNVTNIGLTAQNVEAVFPELVSENKDGYKQVDFTSLPFYIIEAVKELWFKVSGLEEKVKEIDELERRIERLESIQNITHTPSPQPQNQDTGGSEQVAPEESQVTEEVAPQPQEEPEMLPPEEQPSSEPSPEPVIEG